jgi:hypothetical protein
MPSPTLRSLHIIQPLVGVKMLDNRFDPMFFH